MTGRRESLALHLTGVAHGWSMVLGKVISGLERSRMADGETSRYEELCYFFCARHAELTRAIIADSIDSGEDRTLSHEAGFQEGMRGALQLATGDYAGAMSATQLRRVNSELVALREQFLATAQYGGLT